MTRKTGSSIFEETFVICVIINIQIFHNVIEESIKRFSQVYAIGYLIPLHKWKQFFKKDFSEKNEFIFFPKLSIVFYNNSIKIYKVALH